MACSSLTKSAFYSIAFFFLSHFFPNLLVAQTPGGVDVRNGSDSLLLWHRAEDIPVPVNNQITANWPPAFGNGVASFHRAPTGHYEVYNNFNFNPGVNLIGDAFENDLDLNTIDDINVFSVYRPLDNVDDPIWGNGTNNQRYGRQLTLYKMTNGRSISHRTDYNHDLANGTRQQTGALYINQIALEDLVSENIYINGTNVISNNNNRSTLESNYHDIDNDLWIGLTGDDFSFSDANIQLAEFVVYSGNLTQNEQERITSYLGIKYGLTLPHDYYLADGTTIWNTTAAGVNYTNNIIGIGYDADPANGNGSLRQDSSTSQQSGDFLELYADPTTFFVGTNRQALMASHNGTPTNAFDPYVTSIGNITTQRRMRRIWRTESFGNYNNYTIAFDSSMTFPVNFNANNNKVLVVADNDTFTTNVRFYPITLRNGKYSATGVSFNAGTEQFFTIADAENTYFTNNDPGAPFLFEACYNSSVTFKYNNLANHPDAVELVSSNGFGQVINLSGTSIVVNPLGVDTGNITFTIPIDAATGPVVFFNNGVPLDTSDQFLIIHNPTIDFIPQTNPLCATDSTIELYGFPSGGMGTFSSPTPGVLATALTGSILDANQIGWTPNTHDSAKTIDIQYSYTDTYTDGSFCDTAKTITKPITLYDNRLDQLDFKPLIKKDNVPNLRQLTLDTTQADFLINALIPNIFCNPSQAPCYSYDFTGTFVNQADTFLADLAATSNPVTLSFNNNGCIGEVTGNLDVYEPLNIAGLPDTLCIDADSVFFQRDPNPLLSFKDTIINGERHIANKVDAATLLDPTQANAVITLSLTPGVERFAFLANALTGNPTEAVVRMQYSNAIRDSASNAIIRTDTFLAIDTIIIVQRPILSISGLESAYCADGSTDTIQGAPPFEYSSRTSFSLIGADSAGVYNLPASMTQDSIIDPISIYNTLVPQGNRNLPVQLTYTVDRFGCTDQTTANFTIRAPLEPSFLAKSAYCLNEAPSLLQRNVLTSGVQESWVPALGLDTSSGSFNPTVAGIGEVPVTYILTDQFNCRYDFTDTLLVKAPPIIEMTLDGSRTNTIFCANPVDIDIRSRLIIGTIIDTVFYSGPGVIDSTFNPNSAFAGGGGTLVIQAEATDTSGCITYDNLSIQIIQAPSINIDVDFNNIPTFGVTPSEHKYCKSDEEFVIDGRPNYIDAGGVVRGTITGEGVKLINNTYYYDPSQVALGTEIDVVRYTYTDSIGCLNIDSAVVRLDSVPIVSLSGFVDTNFCSNDTNVQLLGSPNQATSLGTAVYKGPGVNPNNGLFTPNTAGTGSKTIIYEFEDSRGCLDGDTVDIVVYAPIKAEFTGYRRQYCTNDTVRLWSQNDTTTGSYYFYGDLVIDSIGILSASDTTTGPRDVFYAYVDSNNCTDIESENIFIHPTPAIEIYGLDSAYCYNDPIDRITVSPAGILSNLTGDTAFFIQANTITFTPNVGPPGIKTFTYSYTDNNNCGNNLVVQTYVHRPPLPTITGLDTFLCETNAVIDIYGTPYWGIFSGPGIVSDPSQPIDSIWGIIPSTAGVGSYVIKYTVLDTFELDPISAAILGNRQINDSVCSAEHTLDINVRPLPRPRFLAPVNNTQFCSNDSVAILLTDTLNPVWHNFRDTSGGVTFTIDSIYQPVGGGLFRFIPDTTYLFNPNLVVPGTHSITYIVTDTASYCQDSAQITYTVDRYIPASFTLDSIYCASNPPVLLRGTPTGGLFTRNDSILNPMRGTPLFNFDPAATSVVLDTVIYAVEYGACEDTITKFIQTNPSPQLGFTTVNAPHNTYCLGDDPIDLTITTTGGGSFDGSPGVLAGDPRFFPDLAGAGSHIITLESTDSTTGCANTLSDTLYVYGRPNLDFEVNGGCQFDSIFFNPNNVILGLNNTDQTRVVDSITSVEWVFSPTVSVMGGYGSNQVDSNVIDSIPYVYNNAGIYYPQLIVANQVYCADTQKVRLVISPKVNSFPYEQDFEADAGDWFAESRDSSHSLLWEWGVDNNSSGIPADPSNHIWATQTNAAYGGGEDTWVYSPCFDLDSLTRPMISLDYWVDTRPSADGAVIEYQRADGIWAPVGGTWDPVMNGVGGINWFNTSFISGQPGDQDASILLGTGWTAPLGWSGESLAWQNGRYKLDDFRGNQNTLRLRIAFASPAIQPIGFYDGFAFDNVVVRDRTRNVLLETMVNEFYNSMENINNDIYQLVYHTTLNKDVVMLQYHIGTANATDAFNSHNSSLGDTRALEYSVSPPGRSFIDGLDSNRTYVTRNLSATDFEQDMLEDPKFSIDLDPLLHINSSFNITATVTALEDMPVADYRIYVVISEDSLNYPNGSNYTDEVHAVARENDQFHLEPTVSTNNSSSQAWQLGETKVINFSWDHSRANFINYAPGTKRFQAVVFIQNTNTKEIFQVATTRDVSGYLVGVDPVEAEAELKEIQNVNLFPNPAHDYFNLKFDQALEHDYQWKLVDIRGVEVAQGTISAGVEQITVDGLNCPSGTYIMVLYNDSVFVNRKVVLGRP